MKVCDVCDLVNGRAFKPSDWGSYGLPIVRIQNLNNESAPFNFYSGEYNPAHEINDGELLFSWSGTPGTSFGAFRWYRGKGILNQHIYKVVPKINIDKDYLRYALNGNLSRIISKAHGGVGLQHITKKELNEITLRIVSNDEQRKIVALLNQTQSVIDARRTQLAMLDKLVKCRFVELFCRNHNTHNDNLIASLDELMKKNIITYHLDGNHGSDYPRSHEFIEAGGITYISANCILNGHIDYSSAKHLSNERAYKLRKGIAKNGDVLFAHNATVGPVAILETEEERIILGTSLTAYRCNFDYVLPQYLKAYMESEYFVSQYANEMKQTTRNQVPITAQRKYTFIIPPIDLQTTFATFVRRVDKLRFVIQQSLDETQKLFDKLMQEYFD